MTPVAILSPGYPDKPGGVTDHTARLLASWAAHGHDTFVIGDFGHQPKDTISKLAVSSAKSVLIQYVPFLYGRRGLSRLPESFAKAARARGVRVTTFVHEPWVPANRPKWWVLSPLQKRQLRRLLPVSDAVVTAVPSWQRRLGDSVELIYVGCVQPPINAAAERGPLLDSPVVFSPFAAGLNWDWIAAAAADLDAGAGLVIVGADHDAMRSHPHVGQFYNSNWDCRGRLQGTAVLETLSRARLVLAPFIDGATGRRTSIAAALSVGAPVLSSRGHLFDPAFDGPVTIASDAENFISSARKMWDGETSPDERTARLEWYREHLDPATLDKTLYQTVTGSVS